MAARQEDVFTADQAVEEGWTLRQVRRRIESGRWQRVAGRGIAARGCPVDPFPATMLAWAARLTWSDAVACRRTAACLWGWPVPPADVADVLTARGRRPLLRLRPHVTPDGTSAGEVRGLAITDRRTTALDCLALLPFDDALDLFAWLDVRGVVAAPDVAEAVAVGERRPGTVQLRRLLEVVASGAASAAEHRLHELLHEAHLTGWRPGASIVIGGRIVAAVDVLFEAERVVIEVDGERSHTGREAFVRDRRRQNALVNAGYTVLRYTWWDLTQRPDAVQAEIRRAVTGR